MAPNINMNPFNYFEKIFCINLDHRTDRWNSVQEEFKKADIAGRVERFSAIKENDGHLGVIKSNLELIKFAQNNNLNNFLVFEDDLKFVENEIQKYLSLAIEQLKDLEWSLFYLGANTHSKLEQISSNLYRAKKCYTVHAMAYNKIVYNKVVEQYKNITEIRHHNDILDVFLSNEIQANNMCLLIYPLLATQKNDYSDIEKKKVNQNYIKRRYKNNIK